MITSVPPIAIHLRVSSTAVERAEGEHADLIGDHGGQQHVAGLDRAQAVHLAQERAAPQALHGEGAGIVAEIQRQDRSQARIAQHLEQALQHLARRLRLAGRGRDDRAARRAPPARPRWWPAR